MCLRKERVSPPVAPCVSTFVGLWAMVRWFKWWLDWPMVLGLLLYCRYRRRRDGCDVWSYRWVGTVWIREFDTRRFLHPAGGVCLFCVFAMRLMMRIRMARRGAVWIGAWLLLLLGRSSPSSLASYLPFSNISSPSRSISCNLWALDSRLFQPSIPFEVALLPAADSSDSCTQASAFEMAYTLHSDFLLLERDAHSLGLLRW